MWNEIGKIPLEQMYYDPYKEVQLINIEAGWANKEDSNYGLYYPVVLFIESIEKAIAKRDTIIQEYQTQYDALQQNNTDIGTNLLIANNFTEEQLVRLSAFLREDELQLDDIVETDLDDTAASFKIKQDAMEEGRIQLNKLCQPQLKFSMTMANIYALPEFEPIINQFQLGKVIKVGIRPDYIKQSRLLQIDMNFDDFSDFSCEFGDLTTLRSQSDIHADLLKKAVQAGKSVATSGSYWTKGANVATEMDSKIEKGLLDATTQIKSLDGTQDITIDKYGLHLQKKNPTTGEIDRHQAWFVNNSLLFTDDNWKTSKMGIGQFTINEQELYGLIADAVLAGYIEGSKIVGSEIFGSAIEGGTIKIGEYESNPDNYAFEVDKRGNVKMLGGKVQFTETENSITRVQEELNIVSKDVQDQIDAINSKAMYDVQITAEGPTTMTKLTDTATLTCKVYSWDVDVTDNLNESAFRWIRTSNNTEQDVIWNAMSEHQGVKSITINVDDIDDSASFSCEVDLPEQ